jgi:hypothetical protein
MRLSEFWLRLEDELGPVYARSWAHDQVLGGLDSRTVDEALEAGVETKEVWRAVATYLELPPVRR